MQLVRRIILASAALHFAAIGQNAPGEDDVELDIFTSEQMRGLHGKIDGNGDGKVSMTEIMGFSERMRSLIAGRDIDDIAGEMDTDNDGMLSVEELVADLEQWGADEDPKEKSARIEAEREKFRLADGDGDGKLSKKEMVSLFYPETHEGILALHAKLSMEQKDLNKDGKLTSQEFWEGDVVDTEDLAISEEEEADFRKLDTDKDGFISLEELKRWESGHFHTEEAMKRLLEIADRDHDMHLSAEEMDHARDAIAGSDAQYHLMEWAEHSEL